MAKHRADFSWRALFYGEFYQLRNRWRFFVKPDLKRKVRNVLDRI